jgi:hypothetical protein
MSDDITSQLDNMPLEEWSTLLDFLPLAIEPFYFERTCSTRVREAWPRKPRSHRLAFLLGTKAPAAYGRAAFLNYFRTDAGESHKHIAEFRQFWALEAALAGTLPWRSALSVIRSTYSQGASSHLVRLLFREGITLPDDVVDTILARAKSDPVALWDLAESIASMRARKAVRAVGRVAREERWFAN